MLGRVELDVFVSDKLVEHVYQRAQSAQKAMRRRRTPYMEAYRQRGVRLAAERDPKLLKFLELAAERLWKLQEPQRSRFRQEGHDGYAHESGEFTEFSTFKQAMLLMDQLHREQDCRHEVFGWLYGAVAEAVYGAM